MQSELEQRRREEQRQIRAREISTRNAQIVSELGSILGGLYITYVHGREDYGDNWQDEARQDREAFAQKTVELLRHGTIEQAVSAISAILRAGEEKAKASQHSHTGRMV